MQGNAFGDSSVRATGPVDLTSCDREPIHIPGAIQPHGVLLALSADLGRVVTASDNCLSMLGTPVEQVLGQPLSAAVGVSAARRVLDRAAADNPSEPVSLVLPGPAERGQGGELAGREVDVGVHWSDDRLVVELEALGPGSTTSLSYRSARGAMARLSTADSLPSLADRLAQETREMTGFDRVMVYRFDEHWNGEVIAENRRDDLNPFLGLHYPSTDIPVQARRLYTINWTRLIADVHYVPVPLRSVGEASTGAPLDLSFSTLRSVSPIHIEYLGNMGVTASMSVSLIVDDRLWGLIACHHYSGPHRPSHDMRAAAEFLGQVASSIVSDRERADMRDDALVAQSILTRITARLSADAGSPLDALMADPELLTLLDAQGAALWFAGRLTTAGLVPEGTIVKRVASLLEGAEQVIVHTDNLAELDPELQGISHITSGALRVGFAPEAWVLWLRPELEQVVDWGGDPTNKQLAAAEGPEVRLSPRKSFDKWRQVVRGRSQPWAQWQADAAEALGKHLTGLLLMRSREQIAMAESIQRSVVRAEAPQFDGLELAARYLPASTFQLGGDWWDAFAMPDHRVAFVVGDVAGHGVGAATAMTQVRTALRAYLFDGYSAADSLGRLDRLMDGLLDQRTATAVVAIVDPSTGLVQVASAGHLAPVLVDETGARQVVVDSRPLLGVGTGTATMTDMELPAGATLLLYTDGLIERRRVHIDESIEQLLAAAVGGPGEDDLATWVNRLLGAVPGSGDDDTTLLAVRIAPVAVERR